MDHILALEGEALGVFLFVTACVSILHSPFPFRILNRTSKERGSGEDATISSAVTLEAAAPDIHHEEALFVPRSEAQEKANAGNDDVVTAVRPTGAWVEAAKELVPPPPPPEVFSRACWHSTTHYMSLHRPVAPGV